MNFPKILKSKFSILLTISFLIAAIGIAGYKWYYRFGFVQAPDINMTTLRGGKQLNLTSFHGKPILLTFWASDCPICLHDIPKLKKLYHDFSPKGLQIVAVAAFYDKLERLQKVVQEKELPYPVTYDKNKAMFNAVKGHRVTPTTFLINPQGRPVMKEEGKMNIKMVREKITAMLNNG